MQLRFRLASRSCDLPCAQRSATRVSRWFFLPHVVNMISHLRALAPSAEVDHADAAEAIQPCPPSPIPGCARTQSNLPGPHLRPRPVSGPTPQGRRSQNGGSTGSGGWISSAVSHRPAASTRPLNDHHIPGQILPFRPRMFPLAPGQPTNY
jgi:hypothetical protein